MKKFFKFMPVALAVVALASCSSDDLTEGNAIAQQDPGKLYVSIENLADGNATRAGFVESYSDDALHRVTVFEKTGDVIKIYDDKQDWRPQEWRYTGATDGKYQNSIGMAEFVPTNASVVQYQSGYGVYPSKANGTTFGEFTNENRTAVKFYFDNAMKVINPTFTTSNLTDEHYTSADKTRCIYTPVPMWGVAKDGKMTMKYLTGFLRIDVPKVPATALNNSKWLLIKSNNALRGDFTAEGIQPDNASTGLTKAAPALVAPAADETTAIALNAFPKTNYNAVGENNTTILVNLGQFEGNLVVYVPVQGSDAGVNHNFDVYLSNNVANAAAIIDFTAGWQLTGGTVSKKVKRGNTYNIIDDMWLTNTTAQTPYQLAQAIINADKEAERDFTLNIQQAIKVKNNDETNQNYDLDLSGYALKHKVTVNVTLRRDVDAMGDDIMFVKTAEGSKDLTLNITKDGAHPQQYISFKNADVKSNIILKGEVTNVLAGSDKLTISSTVNGTVYATDAPVNIDASTLVVNELRIGKGCTKANLLNGTVTTLDFGNGGYAPAIAANVEVATSGKTHIGTIDYANVPTQGTGTSMVFKNNVKFTTKWDGTFTDGTLTNIANAKDITSRIVTAGQLLGYDYSADAKILTEVIDLDKQAVAPIATLTKSVNGDINMLPTASGKTFKATEATAATIKNYYSDDNGLFAQITPAADITINNLVFDEAEIGAPALAQKKGILAGEITATGNTVDLENITVSGTISGTRQTKYFGGVIGQVNDDVNLRRVNSDVLIAGYQDIGGIIGNVAAGTVVFQVTNKNGVVMNPNNNNSYQTDNIYCEAEAILTHNTISSIDYSTNYATDGQFIGSVTAGADVTIVMKDLPAYTDAFVRADALWAERDAYDDVIKYNIRKLQEYIGFSGLVGDGTTQNIVQKAAGWTNVTFRGSKTALNSQYQTRVYDVKPAKITSPADNGLYYLNTVEK
jgi:hypothetical protein